MSADEMLIAITVLIAVVPWAMSIHAKVALIAAAMEGMPEFVSKTQARLEHHEQAIQALQAAAAARH
jgi:hypothetical protein